MANSKLNPTTPGVYIEEIRAFPPSVAQVPTAIPAFIGYTQRAVNAKGEILAMRPWKISSMIEYEKYFGRARPEAGSLTVNIVEEANGSFTVTGSASEANRSPYLMYYALQWFYINGGGDCYIVSVGNYDTGVINTDDLLDGLNETDKVDEVTLLLFPDATNLSNADNYYNLYGEALDKCVELKDRFVIMDVYTGNEDDPVQTLRDKTPPEADKLKYGAAYYPVLKTNLDFIYGSDPGDDKSGDENVVVTGLGDNFNTLKKLLDNKKNALYYQAKQAVRDIPLLMHPSSGMAGVYARVDSTRGVWKSPANVGLDFVIEPTILITDKEQGELNVDSEAGKSINVIRQFAGRGAGIVWGARTLAGNDNEWRYISVRRYANMVEESIQNAAVQFVFEPNDANTWTQVKAMIDNFLTLQWRAGALAGATPEAAFYVKVGLNVTMTFIDILEGRMIVEVGLAIVRPAEFIILQFIQKMQES